MLDELDGFFDIAALILLWLILTTVIVGYVWLGSLPGSAAARRRHPQTEAVTVLGWVGLVFVFLWPIALTWAFVRSTGQSTAKEAAP